MPTRAPMHFAAAETRDRDAVALKLLALALAEVEPDATLHVFGAPPAAAGWLAARPGVRLHPPAPATGWNIKPHVLTALFDAGIAAATWLDADVLPVAPIAPLIARHPPGTLLIAEDLWKFSTITATGQARAWGYTPGRALTFFPNGCFLHVSAAAHRPLMEAWIAAMARPDYVAAQAMPYPDRPLHLVGDQDALSALLGSADFAALPVAPLRRGRDVAHLSLGHGYNPVERLGNLRRGLPPLLHACGAKPWDPAEAHKVHQQLSPYRLHARRYRAALDPAEAAWLDGDGVQARLWQAAFAGDANLAGLPNAAWGFVADRAAGAVRRVLR